MILRTESLDFLIRSKDKQLIKVVSGISRCGKSTLLEIYRDYLLDHGIDQEQLIFINFEDLSYNHLRDYMKFFPFVMERVQPDKMNYIFLDEIQHVTKIPEQL